jgi:agmatine deiminase
VHWDYDCYGAPGKMKLDRPAMMPEWQKDHEAGRALLQHYGMDVFECPLHLEGGSIHSDGEGWVACLALCCWPLHVLGLPQLAADTPDSWLAQAAQAAQAC